MALPVLRKGDKHSMVRELQRLLNRAGRPSPRLGEDGDFGEQTYEAVLRFQRDRKLEADGVVGPSTWSSLKEAAGRGQTEAAPNVGPRPPAVSPNEVTALTLAKTGTPVMCELLPRGLPATITMSEAEKFDLYSRYVVSAGTEKAIQELDSGRRVILGLRVSVSTRSGRDNIYGVYNDRFVVLWQDSGGKHAREFVGTTQPAAKYEDQGPGKQNHTTKYTKKDVDGDGRGDLGRIKAGTHTFVREEGHKHYGNVLRPKGNLLPGERDTNHDGFFDARDKAGLGGPDTLQVEATLFHRGYNSETGSAGCQTMNKPVFDQFWSTLGKQQEFQYVLVDVT